MEIRELHRQYPTAQERNKAMESDGERWQIAADYTRRKLLAAGWDEWRIDDALQEALYKLLEAGKLEGVSNTYLYNLARWIATQTLRRDVKSINLDEWIKRRLKGG